MNSLLNDKWLDLGSAVVKGLTILASMALVAGCGKSVAVSSDTVNRAPAANAGIDQTVAESTSVQLVGTAVDPDAGDVLTYSWSQIEGTSVVLNGQNQASANFSAPDVAAGVTEQLLFRLTVTDSSGLTATDDVTIRVQEPGSVVTISGNVLYEFPPPNNGCNGLNFGNIQFRPVRQVTIQLLDAAGATVLDSTVTDDTGAYALNAASSTNVMLRVRAELKRAGAPSWDVEVRNNVVDPGDPNPPPLSQRPLYVLDSSVFSSGATDQTRDLTATTGWGGSSYTGTRAAAPFAIIDAIYNAVSLVVSENPVANFEPLDAYWSPDNVSTQGAGNFNSRADSGEIGTSFYTNDMLFLLGRDGDDTEEFDDHVIVHEWGHYFEDNFSRSDSIGGQHGVGDLLDMRVAFGEGFATALSGMALNSPDYCDTLWVGNTLRGFLIDIEGGNPGTEGWYNEVSVLRILYDLWDSDNDGVDTSSIGFGPIFNVMTGSQAVTPVFTSIFSFAAALNQQNTGQDAFINSLLSEEGINPLGINANGSNENNDGPGTPDDVFSIYTPLTLGSPLRICANSQFDSGRTGNKLSEHRYLTFSLAAAAPLTFSMTTDSPPSTPSAGFVCTADPDDPESHEHSDPDFLVWQNGTLRAVGNGCVPNSEVVTTNGNLPAGDYVIDINEFRHEDDDSPVNFPEQICFDFTASL